MAGHRSCFPYILRRADVPRVKRLPSCLGASGTRKPLWGIIAPICFIGSMVLLFSFVFREQAFVSCWAGQLLRGI